MGAMTMEEWRRDDVGGLAIWCRGRGRNSLVVLHGGPGLSEYTSDFGELLGDELGEDWTVVRFQQRGLAPSTIEGPFTVEQHVADVIAVSDSVGGERRVLLGHSWGGHLALHVAVADPERFTAMVIVDPLGAVADGGRAGMFEHFVARLTQEEAAAWLDLQARLEGDEPTGPVAIAQMAILWRYYFAEPQTAPSMPPMTANHEASTATFASIEEHFANETLVQGLPRVSTPTLFLAGTKSPIRHVESERSAALMPRAELIAEPTGHFPWLEDSAMTVSTIAGFIQRRADVNRRQ
jgi:pimeloyl-ACP methyl ester carboxylesterase